MLLLALANAEGILVSTKQQCRKAQNSSYLLLAQVVVQHPKQL
jgi:hypothetical protein